MSLFFSLFLYFNTAQGSFPYFEIKNNCDYFINLPEPPISYVKGLLDSNHANLDHDDLWKIYQDYLLIKNPSEEALIEVLSQIEYKEQFEMMDTFFLQALSQKRSNKMGLLSDVYDILFTHYFEFFTYYNYSSYEQLAFFKRQYFEQGPSGEAVFNLSKLTGTEYVTKLSDTDAFWKVVLNQSLPESLILPVLTQQESLYPLLKITREQYLSIIDMDSEYVIYALKSNDPIEALRTPVVVTFRYRFLRKKVEDSDVQFIELIKHVI